MIIFWTIAAVVFLVISFLLAKLSLKYYKEGSGVRMWKIWGIRTAYFEGVVLVSGLLTSLVMFLLAKASILPL